MNAYQRHANRIILKYANGKEESFWLAAGEMKLIDPEKTKTIKEGQK